MTVYSESFLNKHSSEIKQKTRNPLSLADTLRGKNIISDEMYSNIQTKKQEVNQMREIYKYLNSKVHFDLTYNWLKENEPDLVEELDKSDSEAAAPQKKRSRGETNQTVDETDNNHTGDPADVSESETDLKRLSTFAKLENWVSKPEISQKLINDLEEKLGEKGMEALKKELNDKEPKNSLCFNAKNFDEIKKNRELEKFLDAKNKAKFPKLTFSMFFKNRRSKSSGKKAESSYDYDEPTDTTVDDLNSSGYGSYKSDQSLLNLTQSDDQTSDDIFTKCSYNRDTDFNENKDHKDVQETPCAEMDGQPQPGSSMGSTSTSGAVKDQTGEPSCSSNKPALGTKKSEMKQENNFKKQNDLKKKLLHDWTRRQCNGSKEELNNIVDQISIINKAEHDYDPCFTAENVIVHKNPTTCESQIIFITEGKISNTTKTMVHYLMFVCKVKRATILSPSETKEAIEYEECFLRINKCKRFIFEAFAPALAVYKKIQKEELCSLI